MNITVRNEYRVEVLLSAEEMKIYGITYEEMDYSNTETRRVLWSLANDIKKLSGVTITLSGKLLIEVMKENPDSIRICFTMLSEKEDDPISIKQLVKCESLPVIAEFNNIEDVISAAEAVEANAESMLFESNGKYRLMLYAGTSEKGKLAAVTAEFGKVLENSRTEEARCREMWNCIISENALQVIIRTFLMSR